MYLNTYILGSSCNNFVTLEFTCFIYCSEFCYIMIVLYNRESLSKLRLHLWPHHHQAARLRTPLISLQQLPNLRLLPLDQMQIH